MKCYLNRSQQENTFRATQGVPVGELCSCKSIVCNETRHTQLWLFTKTAEENWADMWVPPLLYGKVIVEAYHSFNRKTSSDFRQEKLSNYKQERRKRIKSQLLFL
jgi:hypothetical protein